MDCFRDYFLKVRPSQNRHSWNPYPMSHPSHRQTMPHQFHHETIGSNFQLYFLQNMFNIQKLHLNIHLADF